ncbi:hypothetical protein TNCT_432121 [Trichonephila clavata]|uniref:Uncharacterized protein n=1 Tax=Trichonephila clavata TaxID=2740835 RepID=A0A8X6HQV4_TRICU|nr:hypothetical protein TNCT_432121 [Trichonephila clavata]
MKVSRKKNPRESLGLPTETTRDLTGKEIRITSHPELNPLEVFLVLDTVLRSYWNVYRVVLCCFEGMENG